MDKIKVELLSYDDIKWAYYGLRICTDTLDKVENNEQSNRKLLEHALSDEVPHYSVIKHIHYKFLISGIPRSLLQEIARHQVGVSINVLSTRWALHKAFKNLPDVFDPVYIESYYFISKELKDPENEKLYMEWLKARYDELKLMKKLREEKHFSNDKLKNFVNENFRTKVFMDISALALRNLFNQRLYKDAWYVFRHVAMLMLNSLPVDHMIIYQDIIEKRLEVNK